MADVQMAENTTRFGPAFPRTGLVRVQMTAPIRKWQVETETQKVPD